MSKATNKEAHEELVREAVRLARAFKELDGGKFAVIVIVAEAEAPSSGGRGILTFGNLGTEDKMDLIRCAGESSDYKVIIADAVDPSVSSSSN